MGIAPRQLLPFINIAFDGMLKCVEQLGDERVNQRPDLAEANSPYVILHHCVQLTYWWVGTMCLDGEMERDRDSEFLATGRVGDLQHAVSELKEMLEATVPAIDPALPLCRPDLLPEDATARSWTRGECLVHTYEELAQHHGHMEITRDILLRDAAV